MFGFDVGEFAQATGGGQRDAMILTAFETGLSQAPSGLLDLHALLFLGTAYGAFECCLAALRRSSRVAGAHAVADRRELPRLWAWIAVAVLGSALSTISMQRHWGPNSILCQRISVVLFVFGLSLRVWSILSLGRFFTVDVAILEGHRLVQVGPYRCLRHPSYTGVLLVVAALALLLGNGISLMTATGGITAVLVQRIRVEERVLAARFGDEWAAHCDRTWRLVPFVW